MSAPGPFLDTRPALPASSPLASRGLLAAVVAGLGLAALTDLFSVVVGIRLRNAAQEGYGFFTADQQELEAAAELYEKAGMFQGTAYLACAIVFLCWFFRMRRTTGLMAPDQFRRGPGWAVGTWFIPLANLWMPYRIAMEMWMAATFLPHDGGQRQTRTWPVNTWWALFVLGTLLNRYAGTSYKNAETLQELESAVRWYLIADLTSIAAAAAAAHFAVRLTALQRRKAVEGPYGHQASDAAPAGRIPA
ncbi:DUF4328 domain-containing protein [Streptomyces glaucescens]|uniref:DUF4328 domain-containing protein n=1 Tax=Streptomyces glaucescens TaxID=1907 RepID=UPI003450FCCD